MFKDLLDLFYPNTCKVCQRWLVTGEQHICTYCYDELPRTGFLLQKENPSEKILWGRVPLSEASSFLYFHQNGITQKLLHRIKYRGNKELATGLGRIYARELKQSAAEFKPDLLIPVPLHKRKERQRGYNQSLHFAEGIAEELGVELLPRAIKRNIYTETQTSKTRYRRWENVSNIFEVVTPELLRGKHIVMVDDVITTGATMEACMRSADGLDARIGFLTLALAKG